MLSRVADNLYWMARFMERAENLARLLQASNELLLDGETTGSRSLNDYWDPVLVATAMEEEFARIYPQGTVADVGFFITLHEGNPYAITMCLRQARENARTVRDQISDEMWTELNDLYLFITAPQTLQLFQASPQSVYDRIISGSLLFHGITDATLARTEGWQFIQLGKYLERADKTSRFLDIRVHSAQTGNALDSFQWTCILRSASAIGTYRAEVGGEPEAKGVIDLLMFSTDFPRSVRYCVQRIDATLHAISGSPTGSYSNAAERFAGRLLAQLNFGCSSEVLERGLQEYTDDLQQILNDLGQQIFETYVLLPQDQLSVTFIPSADTQQRRWLELQQQQQQQQQQ